MYESFIKILKKEKVMEQEVMKYMDGLMYKFS